MPHRDQLISHLNFGSLCMSKKDISHVQTASQQTEKFIGAADIIEQVTFTGKPVVNEQMIR